MADPRSSFLKVTGVILAFIMSLWTSSHHLNFLRFLRPHNDTCELPHHWGFPAHQGLPWWVNLHLSLTSALLTYLFLLSCFSVSQATHVTAVWMLKDSGRWDFLGMAECILTKWIWSREEVRHRVQWCSMDKRSFLCLVNLHGMVFRCDVMNHCRHIG